MIIKLRYIFLLTIIVGIILLFTTSSTKESSTARESVDYTQQATAVVVYEFNDDTLVAKSTADTFSVYEDDTSVLSGAHLNTPEYEVRADAIRQSDDQVLELSGEIDITYTEQEPHALNTTQLFFDPSSAVISSSQPTQYTHNDNVLHTQGIHIHQNNIQLIGTTVITTPEYVLHTHNAMIDNEQGIYTSNKPSTLSHPERNSLTTAQKGFRLVGEVLNLIGETIISFPNAQLSSTGVHINTVSGEFSTSEESKYTTANLKVNAKSMHYNEPKETIYLYENVQAIYF